MPCNLHEYHHFQEHNLNPGHDLQKRQQAQHLLLTSLPQEDVELVVVLNSLCLHQAIQQPRRRLDPMVKFADTLNMSRQLERQFGVTPYRGLFLKAEVSDTYTIWLERQFGVTPYRGLLSKADVYGSAGGSC